MANPWLSGKSSLVARAGFDAAALEIGEDRGSSGDDGGGIEGFFGRLRFVLQLEAVFVESDIFFGGMRKNEVTTILAHGPGAVARLQNFFVREQIGHFVEEQFGLVADFGEKIGELILILGGVEAAKFGNGFDQLGQRKIDDIGRRVRLGGATLSRGDSEEERCPDDKDKATA